MVKEGRVHADGRTVEALTIYSVNMLTDVQSMPSVTGRRIFIRFSRFNCSAGPCDGNTGLRAVGYANYLRLDLLALLPNASNP
jgi:hypothetical protein